MNLRYKNHRCERGFSLLEILVAFSILALSLGVLFQIYSRGSNVTALSRDYSQALIVAQSQLAALNLTRKITLGEESGLSKSGIKWQRRLFANEEEQNAGIAFNQKYQLINVEVVVHWETLGRPHNFTLKSLRLAEIR